jgi:hypothetical protein
MGRTITAGIAVAVLMVGGLGAAPPQAARTAAPASASPTFRDVASQAGLDFTHINGASDEKFFPEIIGSGGLFLDFDNDGWLDVFLVDGGSYADPAVAKQARHRLFRNRHNGTFEDVTAASNIRHRDYGMGACAGDIDNDGLIDLYITNVGPNVLYRNAGNGRFDEVPKAGGADSTLWSTSCAFVDFDRDGDLDLFVTNYVDLSRGTNPSSSTTIRNEFCGFAGPPAVRDYCHPLIYPPLPSVLYRNTGKGTFEDVSMQAGIASFRGNGLGVAVSDIDDDGWPDVFVANDSTPNFLFHNSKNGSFTEIAGLAGVAVASDGKARAGMGTAFGDFAGTGRLGLIVTNHETEMHSLFLNQGAQLFSDATIRSGIGPATRPYVGFGVVFFDYDNDGRLDVSIVNGNVMANVSKVRAGGKLAQRKLLLHNDTGERFVDVTKAAGPGFAVEGVGRALAAGDVDNDGDLDLLVTNNGGRVNLLLNDGGNAANAIVVQVIGTKSNRSGIGTKLTLSTGQHRQVREVQSGSSYLAQNDLRAHFGIGRATVAERLEVRWPDGSIEMIPTLAANQVVTVRQGKGLVNRAPLTGRGRP